MRTDRLYHVSAMRSLPIDLCFLCHRCCCYCCPLPLCTTQHMYCYLLGYVLTLSRRAQHHARRSLPFHLDCKHAHICLSASFIRSNVVTIPPSCMLVGHFLIDGVCMIYLMLQMPSALRRKTKQKYSNPRRTEGGVMTSDKA
ncbi:hypothetical protein BS17DRAFT_581821 [Gyrodon lividus]|nr:hypothetical protein BS17DRAFT_581821 [Gyrodon lividus]